MKVDLGLTKVVGGRRTIHNLKKDLGIQFVDGIGLFATYVHFFV